MSGNFNKPFAGPRVALPSHFPKSFRNSLPENPCRNLISKLSDQSISSSEFFTQLLSIKSDNREISFSILNCLLFYILNCKPYHSHFSNQFTALFSKLIQNPSEPVRRSVLPLISMLINNNTIFQNLSNEFYTWKDESKEIFLSFAFCFQPPEVFEWKTFISNAKESTRSENESLSCTANDFIEYMNYFLGNEQSEPKVRNSLDLTKEQFRRSMTFRNSMDFHQNQMSETSQNEEENEEENEIQFEDHEKFTLDNYPVDSSSSHSSEIRSLRVSKQKSAMEELENDPFNKKSPFFNSIENDQDETNSNINQPHHHKNENDSLEDSSSIIPTRTNKPQVIESVDLSKLKNESSRKSSKNLPRSKTNSSSKSQKEHHKSRSSKNNRTSDSFDVEVEIDDTNIEIEEIEFDSKSTKSNSSNLSGILDDLDLDLPSQLPKNLSPQKVDTSVASRILQTQSKQKGDRMQSQSKEQRNSQDKIRDDISSSKEKSKHHQRSQGSVSKENLQRKNGRSNQSSDVQTMMPISKSKLQQKSSKSKQQVYKSNGYDQSSESNTDNVSFLAQPARPPSARRGRQNNSSSSELNGPDMNSVISSKKSSRLNFVDIDGVEESSNNANSGNRISSKIARGSKKVTFDSADDDDDDEYSEGLFGAAPDYENKVTFAGPPLPNNSTENSVSASANFLSNRHSTKKKVPQKNETAQNNTKSGNSKTMSPPSSKKRPDSRASNSSTETPPSQPSSSSKAKNKRGSPSNSVNEDEYQNGVYNFVSALGSKDWEEQQKGVEGLLAILDTKPGLISSFCREVWMNLLDIIVSPRSMLSKQALQLAAELFTQFAQQLVPQTALFVDICLNLVCNSRQFIADAAENVIILIAQESPRSKVINSFIKGTSHKNSIARGKAAQCLSILVEQGGLDDREFKAVVQCLAPLVRDNRTETRYAAKETLKLIASDERFRDTAKDVCKNSIDLSELMKCVEL